MQILQRALVGSSSSRLKCFQMLLCIFFFLRTMIGVADAAWPPSCCAGRNTSELDKQQWKVRQIERNQSIWLLKWKLLILWQFEFIRFKRLLRVWGWSEKGIGKDRKIFTLNRHRILEVWLRYTNLILATLQVISTQITQHSCRQQILCRCCGHIRHDFNAVPSTHQIMSVSVTDWLLSANPNLAAPRSILKKYRILLNWQSQYFYRNKCCRQLGEFCGADPELVSENVCWNRKNHHHWYDNW